MWSPVLACGILLVIFRIKCFSRTVQAHFDCAGSHKAFLIFLQTSLIPWAAVPRCDRTGDPSQLGFCTAVDRVGAEASSALTIEWRVDAGPPPPIAAVSSLGLVQRSSLLLRSRDVLASNEPTGPETSGPGVTERHDAIDQFRAATLTSFHSSRCRAATATLTMARKVASAAELWLQDTRRAPCLTRVLFVLQAISFTWHARRRGH